MEIRKCKYCNKELPEDFIKKDKKYCNRKCYLEWRKINPAHNNKNKYVICTNCKKEFRIVPAKIKGSKTGNIFCCKKCKDEYYSEGYSDVNCAYCNNIIHISNAKLKQKQNVYCNKECKAKWESDHWKYENNPNYKGGFFKECKYCKKEYWVYNSEKTRSFFVVKNVKPKTFEKTYLKLQNLEKSLDKTQLIQGKNKKPNLQNQKKL